MSKQSQDYLPLTHPCPCHSGLNYIECCEPYHTGKIPAPTALALMRSRYAAYALGNTDYITQTTHRENPQFSTNLVRWKKDLQAFCNNTQFTALEVLSFEEQDTTATVSFNAHLVQKDQPFILNETSRFFKIGKRWLYHSGDMETKSV